MVSQFASWTEANWPSMILPSLNSRAEVRAGSAKECTLERLANSAKTGCNFGNPHMPMYSTGAPKVDMAKAIKGPFPPIFSIVGTTSKLALLPAASPIFFAKGLTEV